MPWLAAIGRYVLIAIAGFLAGIKGTKPPSLPQKTKDEFVVIGVLVVLAAILFLRR